MSQQWQAPGNGAPPGAWAPPGTELPPPPPRQPAAAWGPPGSQPGSPGPAVAAYGGPAPAGPTYADPGVGASAFGDPAPGQSYADSGAGAGAADPAYGEPGPSDAGLASVPVSRLDSLQSDVAALKIRGGNTRVERQVRVGGAALMAIGVAAIVVAWFKASAPNTSVNNQMAYLMSGGLGGLALVGIGAAFYLRSWMARQRYWQARQVVETREYTAQVLMLLARIEKLLGGTGELPANIALAPGSLWETLPAAAEPFDARRPEPGLIGDPDGVPGDVPGPSEDREPPLVEHGFGLAGDSEAGASEAGASEAGASEPALAIESVSVAEPSRPVYTNEHGHVWDHDAQQWYDPSTHQWFDGIAGHWYTRDAPPPRP